MPTPTTMHRLSLLNSALQTGTPSPRAAVAAPVRASIEHYGKSRFRGAVADHYLRKFGEKASLLEDPSWTKTKADVVAAAVLEWAIDNGADTVRAHLLDWPSTLVIQRSFALVAS